MSINPVALSHRRKGDGVPVVLLHGLFGSSENLGGIARTLATEYEVHSLDLRNHGKSPHSEAHSYPALAADVAAYISTLQSAPVHVVGHSMGGKAAMRLALDAPSSVASLTVIDIAPRPYPRHHDDILSALKSLVDSPVNSREAANERLQLSVPEAAVRLFLLKNLVRSETGYRLRLNVNALIENYHHISDWPETQRVSSVPTLFLAGGASNYITEEDRPVISAHFPNATGRVIPGGSHWVHAEKPELVSGYIARFIAEVVE